MAHRARKQATFKRQIIQDYRWSDGFRTFVVKWVFEPGLSTPEQIRAMMMKALNEALTAGLEGYDPAVVLRIKAMLPQLVEVGLPGSKP